jgi:hypothetical protein
VFGCIVEAGIGGMQMQYFMWLVKGIDDDCG